MDKTTIKTLIREANTFEELEVLKQDFLNECENQHDRLSVAQLLQSINNFSDAKNIFESIVPSLLSKKNGKNLINIYTKTIKENKSLKTLYAYHTGLNENETPEAKKNFITEAVSIGNKINGLEYSDDFSKIIGVIVESFKVLGDKEVLKLVNINENIQNVNASLEYLAKTPKTVKNLNEHINHINIVSNTLVENKTSNINTNLDATLEDVLKNNIVSNNNENIMENIFNENVDKETMFNNSKQLCLNMIQEQRNTTTDKKVTQKLDEMVEKLSKKLYNYDTYTKDMLYMSELQEVLN